MAGKTGHNTVTAGLLAALIAAVAAAGIVYAHGEDHEYRLPGQGMGYGMGPEMMGDYGMMGPGMMGGHSMMGPGITDLPGMGPGRMYGGPGAGLDLSAAQRKEIADIHNGLRKQHWALRGQIIDAQAELFALYADETPDPKKIGAVYGKIFDLKRQMIESAIDARNRHLAVLTAEQREQLRENLYGWGGGYGPGMMHFGFGHPMMGG